MSPYFIQQSEAKSKEEDARSPLSEEGRRDVQKPAQFLKRAGIEFSYKWKRKGITD